MTDVGHMGRWAAWVERCVSLISCVASSLKDHRISKLQEVHNICRRTFKNRQRPEQKLIFYKCICQICFSRTMVSHHPHTMARQEVSYPYVNDAIERVSWVREVWAAVIRASSTTRWENFLKKYLHDFSADSKSSREKLSLIDFVKIRITADDEHHVYSIGFRLLIESKRGPSLVASTPYGRNLLC